MLLHTHYYFVHYIYVSNLLLYRSVYLYFNMSQFNSVHVPSTTDDHISSSSAASDIEFPLFVDLSFFNEVVELPLGSNPGSSSDVSIVFSSLFLKKTFN